MIKIKIGNNQEITVEGNARVIIVDKTIDIIQNENKLQEAEVKAPFDFQGTPLNFLKMLEKLSLSEQVEISKIIQSKFQK